MLLLEIEVSNMEFTIANIYAPNEDNPAFFEKIFQEMQQSNCTDRVIGGDFNLVIEPGIDRYQSSYNSEKAAQVVLEYLE